MALVVKNLRPHEGNVTDADLIPGVGRFPGERKGNPFQHSYLEIPWTEKSGGLQSIGSQKSRIQLSIHTQTHV